MSNLSILAVMEFSRSVQDYPFEERHLQTTVAMVSWIGLVLHQFHVNRSMKSQSELNEFLLGVSK